MSLTVVTSHRLEDLFAALCERVAAAPLPPLETEIVVVPGPGVARWLELRLAERFGIHAGVRMPFVGAFLHELGGGPEHTADPFARDVLVFRLWRLIDAAGRDHRFGPVLDYCRDDADGRKRLQLCQRLADCFDRYQLYRDDLLQAFARGDEQRALSPHAPWQSALWQSLLADADIAVPRTRRARTRPAAPRTPSLFPELDDPAARPADDVDLTRAHLLLRVHRAIDDPQERARTLPTRLTLFGASTLPPAMLELLRHAAEHVPVWLFVPQPTAHYVGDQESRRVVAGDNALLARCGAESRELADLLLELDDDPNRREPIARIDLHEPAAPSDAGSSLLACLQHDVVAAYDRGQPGAQRFRLAADDASLRVHDCHAPQRELEVVRDQVLAALAADPSLEPRDVLVLVPDIDRYAPYAHAVFAPLREQLPFVVADRSPARELPLCRTALLVLELAQDRLARDDVLHVLEVAAVQQRFAIAPAELPLLRHLCDQAAIRWGRDGADRHARHGLPAGDDNTWRAGLDRLVLGTLTGHADHLVLDHLPVGDSTDARSDVLARFTAFVDALFDVLPGLQQAQPLAAWADRVDDLAARLFAATGDEDAEALRQLRRATVQLRAHAAAARHGSAVPPPAFADWLGAALTQNVGSAGFLGGSLTIAAMLPMRAVPVRCLFLCGLDDGSFPRRDQPPAFDLIAAAPRPGDRSRRRDDRQLFLDLLLAARDQLHLTFVGRSVKDNAACAPSPVLAELLEQIDRTCTSPDRRAPRDVVTVQHPLQPWSPRHAAGDDPRLFTFARLPLPPAGERSPDPPWCPAGVALPPADEPDTLAFERLCEFWWHPCRTFLRRTARIRLRADDEADGADEPFTLGHLERYQLQDERLRRFLRGDAAPDDPFALARAAGVLPHGHHGRAAFQEVEADTQQFLAQAERYRATAPRRLAVQLGNTLLAGELPRVGDEHVVYLRIAKLKPKDRLKAWLMHLAVTLQAAQDPTGAWPRTTVLLARDGCFRYSELPLDLATEQLSRFVAWQREGRLRPLLFFPTCSFAAGAALHEGNTPQQALKKARAAWGDDRRAEQPNLPPGDRLDADVRLCMRGRDPLAEPEFLQLAAELWQPACSYLREVDG